MTKIQKFHFEMPVSQPHTFRGILSQKLVGTITVKGWADLTSFSKLDINLVAINWHNQNLLDLFENFPLAANFLKDIYKLAEEHLIEMYSPEAIARTKQLEKI